MPEGKAPDPERLAAAVGAGLDRLPALVGGHHEPLRARPLRERAAARRMAGQAGGTTSPSSRGWRRRAAAIPSCATPAPRRTSTTIPPSTTTTRWPRLIKFQLHDHICTKILKQDVRACDYSGNKEVGDVPAGASCRWAPRRDWRKVIKDATGEAISPRAMMAFYAPLVEDLAKRNAGKDCTR